MKIGIVAGEASGDLLGADLIRAIKQNYPKAQFVGLAGPLMQEQGAISLAEMEKISIMGVVGVLKSLFEIIAIRRKIKKKMLAWQPDVFVGIDVPDFNLGLEVQLKKAGIPTVHYVSPTVWAWREHRIHKIRRAVTLMLTLFPFEENYYQEKKIEVKFVGHPLAQQVLHWQKKQQLITELKLHHDKKLVALLPGSRMSEVSRLAPIMLEAASDLLSRRSDIQFVIPAANTKVKNYLDSLFDGARTHITLIDGQSRDVLALCHCAALASGTAALEAGMFAKPMVVMYKVSKFEEWYAARTMRVKHFSMPNHLLTPPPVPELIQDRATPENLIRELDKLLDQKKYYTELQSKLATIAPTLSVESGRLASAAITSIVRHKEC